MAVHHRIHGLTLSGTTGVTTRCTKGGCKPDVGQRMPGAGLSWLGLGKAPPDKPAFQPYWGKPAVRNDRGDRGDVGIIRSPVRASILPDRRLLLPLRRRLAALDRLVLFARVALLRRRHDTRIHHLPATRNVAPGVEMAVEPVEQLLDQAGLRQLLTEQPQRRAVRDTVLKAKPEKPRERQPVAHLILDLLVRQIVQRLQNQHAEQNERVERFTTGLALLRLLRRQHDRLDIGAEALPRNQRSDHFQRIALLRQHRKPPIRVEKSQLPHRLAIKIRIAPHCSQFFEAPLSWYIYLPIGEARPSTCTLKDCPLRLRSGMPSDHWRWTRASSCSAAGSQRACSTLSWPLAARSRSVATISPKRLAGSSPPLASRH